MTGGSRGIGRAVALMAGEKGYRVAVNYKTDKSSANQVVDAVRANGGIAEAFRGNIAQEADITSLFEQIDDRLGPLCGLVNNAGITGGNARVVDVTAAQLSATMALNVTGAFLCAREAVRRMSTNFGGSGGAIVNVSSGAARLGSPGTYVHYAASKGAIDTMTLGLAREVAEEGIRVNCVRAGITDTDIHAFKDDPTKLKALSQRPPMKRVATPEEIASSIIWLLSNEASYVTGAILDVGGGL